MPGIVTRTTVITPELIAAASAFVKLTHATDASLARALDRASARLLELPWSVDCGILQIASHSHASEVHSTDGTDCTCEASRGVCWHCAAWGILSAIAATGVNVVAALPLPSVLDDDDLPASFLDGDFDAFEDTSLLMLAPVLDAPAFEEVDSPTLRAKRVAFKVSSRVNVPVAGSDFERAQRLADELFAA